METPILLALLITVLPLGAFVIQVFFGRFLPRQGDWVPFSCVAAGLGMSIYLMITQVLSSHGGMEPVGETYKWLSIGESSPFVVNFDVFVDNLTVIMLFVVTLVSALVHLFSMGYMKGENRYNRFFAYLALFTFSMLGLIITSNLLFLFIFWEAVGVCSYFLIGFYFEKPSAAAACKKAFLTNRVGDTCFFLGIMIIAAKVGSFTFADMFASLGDWDPQLLTIAGLLVFMGAVSKSAQFPLHVWLPDAMEGPTPVSALIHAATMVAAGVYMICRMFPFLAGIDPVSIEAGEPVPAMLTGNYFESDALFVVALVGGFTAIFAATVAVTQYDIKKVLAYSTVSQLGYMVMAVGVGSLQAAMFHLFTHAMFKACLFLGSGSVIHAMHHEQDMRKMGGLRHKLPITFWTFLISTLALTGVMLFSGAISKEAILTQAYAFWEFRGGGFVNGLPFLFCLIAAGLTSFYMFRLIFNVFFGKPRDEHAYEHAHESPKSMTIPLVILALMGWFGAGIAIPFVGPGIHWFTDRADPQVVVGKMMTDEKFVPDAATRAAWSATPSPWHDLHAHDPLTEATHTTACVKFAEAYHHAHYPTFFWATGVGLLGIFLSWWVFQVNRGKQYVKEGGLMAAYQKVLLNLYYIDDFYRHTIIAFTHWIAGVFKRIDKVVVDGIVNAGGVLGMALAWVAGKIDYNGVDGTVRGTGELTLMAGRKMRKLQTGRIQDYVGLTVFGMVVVFIAVMAWTSMS